jgi:hypothetical protein
MYTYLNNHALPRVWHAGMCSRLERLLLVVTKAALRRTERLTNTSEPSQLARQQQNCAHQFNLVLTAKDCRVHAEHDMRNC